MSILMSFSPLDALLNVLPDIYEAGEPGPEDTVMTVHARLADIFLPVVKRIQQEAVNDFKRQQLEKL